MPVFPTLVAGQRLTAALLTSALPVTAVQAADQSVTSSTVLVNASGLSFPVVSGASYTISGLLIFNGGAASDDFKTGWTAPASSVLNWQTQAQPVAATANNGVVVTNAKQMADLSSLGTIGAATDLTALVAAQFTAGGTGTLQFKFAQVTSSATATTLRAGSFLVAQRYA